MSFPMIRIFQKLHAFLAGILVLAVGGTASSQTPMDLPNGDPMMVKSLNTGQRCDQVVQYRGIPPEQLQRVALPVTRSFVQFGGITRISARCGDGSNIKAYLTEKLILRAEPSLGVESRAGADPSVVEQFDCLEVARWIAEKNFTGLEKWKGKEYWRFARLQPVFGEQVVLIDPETRLPARYSDAGRNIEFSYSQENRPIVLPPELERAQQQFLRAHSNGRALGTE